jgi:cyclic pyranopterin phosphate synthase
LPLKKAKNLKMSYQLKDNFGRIHNYLRISLTDKCNLRCGYCMPEDNRFFTQSKLMTAGEIYNLAEIFVHEFGIFKIRFTGGEPLSRSDAGEIIESVSKLPIELAITTNGVLLDRFLPLFNKIGVTSVNISLDSLNPERFQQITRRKLFNAVKDNIDSALAKGFNVKINMVVMRNINDDEVIDFAAWTLRAPVRIRFIEFMPFIGNSWEWNKVISSSELMERIEKHFRLIKLIDKQSSTSKSYCIEGAAGTLSFISTVSEPFCESCSRIRLTADGKLQNCLFARSETDLLSPMRNGIDIENLIVSNILSKPAIQGGESPCEKVTGKTMVSIGG